MDLRIANKHSCGKNEALGASLTSDLISVTVSGFNPYFCGYTVTGDQSFLAWLELDGTATHYLSGNATTPVNFYPDSPIGLPTSIKTYPPFKEIWPSTENLPVYPNTAKQLVLKVTNNGTSSGKFYGVVVTCQG